MARILENKTARNIKLNINKTAYEARHLAKPQNVKNNLQKTCIIQNKVVYLQKKLKITNEIY